MGKWALRALGMGVGTGTLQLALALAAAIFPPERRARLRRCAALSERAPVARILASGVAGSAKELSLKG